MSYVCNVVMFKIVGENFTMQVRSQTSTAAKLIPFVSQNDYKPMNIIFDLNGVLFGSQISTPCSIQSKFACALKPINPAVSMRLLFDCIKNGHRLFIISNLSKESFDFLSADPQSARLFNYFEDIILSDKIGIKKPDLRIFDYLLHKYRLDPRSSVFIDDQQINLKAAEQVGITKGILCSDFNFESVRQQLELHGVL